VGERCSDKFRLRIRIPRNSRDLLHAANLRHGTDGFTSPPKEGVLRIFFTLQIATASAGFEPANLGTKGQHATSRPPKPSLCTYCRIKLIDLSLRTFVFPFLNIGTNIAMFHSAPVVQIYTFHSTFWNRSFIFKF